MFGGGGSIQLARVFGIRIGVSPSWFVVLFVFIFALQGYFRDVLGGSHSQAFAVSVAASLLYFASILLHELGHALVARREGVGVAGIDLFFFGGMAMMERDSESPGEEFRVAAAGPLVTLLIVALCTGAGIALSSPSEFADTAVFDESGTVSVAVALLALVATTNAGLFVFNLLPGFPLDGGRIARAAAWKITGDRGRATRYAGRAGQGVSLLLAGLGVFWMLQGGLGNGIWLLVLALFLGQAARAAVVQGAVDERLEGVTVADVMERDPLTTAASTTLIDLSEQVLEPNGWAWIAVVDAQGRFLGVVTAQRVTDELAAGRPALTVGDVLDPDPSPWRIGTDAPLEALLGTEGIRLIGAVFAVDAQGTLRGVVTVDQVRRALTPAR